MRKLIFGILKIIEVILAFAFVGFAAWLANFDVFVLWLVDISLLLFLIVDLGIFFLCLINLILIGFFQDWMKSNWIWTDQIINIFKKRR